MTDESRLADHLGTGDTPAAEYRAKAERLLRRIEDEQILPARFMPVMRETFARLDSLGDALAWAPTAYLSAIIVNGEAMFADSPVHLPFGEPPADVLPCRCGGQATADPAKRRSGRTVRTARCESCGLHLACFDEILYDRPTLITRG